MCGIVGYIGNRKAQDVLLKGLGRLEYRGYDSAGIAVLKDGKIDLVKRKGKLKVLMDELRNGPIGGTVGIGHCLTPDTLIHMADGRILPISRIEDAQEVFAFNIKEHKVEAAKSRVMMHRAPAYLYHLRTPFTTIKCTANHKMYVVSEDKIVEKRAADIKKSDMLIIPKNIEIRSNSIEFRPVYAKRYFNITTEGMRLINEKRKELQLTAVGCADAADLSEAYVRHIFQNDRNFREEELGKLLKTLSIDFSSKNFLPQDTIHGKFITLPDRSSANLMQIIGYMLGDGNVKERCIRFKDMDVDLLQVYEDLISRTFNIRGRIVPIPGTRAWLLEVNSLYLCQWLRENILLRREEFLNQLGQLPKNEIAAFLKGLFDAKGCVNLKSHQISLRMTDRHLVRMAQLLLLKFDIASSSYAPKKVRKEWNVSYEISINNRCSFEKFIQSVNFTSEIKMARLQCLTSVNRKSGKCTVTSDKDLFYQPILKITQVKSDEEFLFDLEVEHPDASFIANGLVSHNSRWATHGAPRLKKRLVKEGHKFSSETDTEVITHLIEKFYKTDLEKAVLSAVKLLKGSYAIAVIHKNEPGKVVGARCDSPLI
ncbi:MAG: hypothetical protein NTW09_03010, partial [Candidatus Omnitrophica bacterium]|nr:hypothetical protein [Candidatus Omnitrophota bacterium]